MPPKPRKGRKSGEKVKQPASAPQQEAPTQPPKQPPRQGTRLGVAELQQMGARTAAAAQRSEERVDDLDATMKSLDRSGTSGLHPTGTVASEPKPVAASVEEGIPPAQVEPAVVATEHSDAVQNPASVAPKFTCLCYTGPGIPVSESLLLPAVVELIRAGTIVADSVVWSAGFDPAKGQGGWVPLESAVELFEWPEGVDVLAELSTVATRRSKEEAAAAANSSEPDAAEAVKQGSEDSAASRPVSAEPEPQSAPAPEPKANLEPEQDPDAPPEPEPGAEPSPGSDSADTQAVRPDLPHVPGLPRRARLIETHVVTTMAWKSKSIYYVLECDQVSDEATDEPWTTIKQFSDFQEVKTKLGIGDQLAAPFPSEKGLETQKHASPQAAAEWLLKCIAADPHDVRTQISTSSTHLAVVPWAAEATACWKWEAGVSMWSSVKSLQEIAAQLNDRSELKPVLLSVFGNVRTVASATPVPMLETHLPIWCTTTLQLAQEAPVQNGLKQFFSVRALPCCTVISSERRC